MPVRQTGLGYERSVLQLQAGQVVFRVHAERALRELDCRPGGPRAAPEPKARPPGGSAPLSTVNSYLIAPLVSGALPGSGSSKSIWWCTPGHPPDIVNGLLANRLDIGICLMPPQYALPHDHRLCSKNGSVLSTSMSIGKSRARMQDLARLPLVLMPVDYCLRKMVEAECAKAGVHPQVVLEMSSPKGFCSSGGGRYRSDHFPEPMSVSAFAARPCD